MVDPIRVIQYGLGPIGSAIARLIAAREGVDLVGGVDIDPAKVGHDVGEVIGLGRPLGFATSETLAAVLERTAANVVLHTTSSYFDLFKRQIIEILEAGLDVVSTAEELSFPWLANQTDAAAIDAVAKQVGKTALGTGVNPGFLMDALPLSLTALCQEIEHMAVTRVINASVRRGPFQAKIGAGMSVEAFQTQMEEGHMGHVGLPESMGMIFDTLGKTLARYETSVGPVVAQRPIKTTHFEIQPGQVKGVKQVARGYAPEGEFVVLTFIAALAMEADGDTITLTGKPNLEITLKGTNGDLSTVAIAANAIRRIHAAAPGLITMRDLPMVTAWA